jgi:TraY domain
MARNDVTIVSAQVSTATRIQLERLARESERSLSGEVRLALREHLKQEQRPAERGAE